jgi:hypothetical protein
VPPAPADARFVTSFGPLARVELTDSARHRLFDARDGVRTETRKPRPGQRFVVLLLERDFTIGAGLVSFLFGSGIIVKPEFEQLVVVDGAGRPQRLAAVYAEGRTVALAYEVAASASAGLRLRDGDAEVPLAGVVTALR